jgi:hypothetical protein
MSGSASTVAGGGSKPPLAGCRAIPLGACRWTRLQDRRPTDCPERRRPYPNRAES